MITDEGSGYCKGQPHITCTEKTPAPDTQQRAVVPGHPPAPLPLSPVGGVELYCTLADTPPVPPTQTPGTFHHKLFKGVGVRVRASV
jgi:hypothetical protein